MNSNYVLTPYGVNIWFAIQGEIVKLNAIVTAQAAEIAKLKQTVSTLKQTK